MNNNCSREKKFIIQFYSLNIKGNSAHLAEKNSRPRAKIMNMNIF